MLKYQQKIKILNDILSLLDLIKDNSFERSSYRLVFDMRNICQLEQYFLQGFNFLNRFNNLYKKINEDGEKLFLIGLDHNDVFEAKLKEGENESEIYKIHEIIEKSKDYYDFRMILLSDIIKLKLEINNYIYN